MAETGELTASGTAANASARADGSPPRPITGYTVILPEGWDRVPLRNPTATDAAVHRILERTFAPFPRDQVFQYRADLESRLEKQIAQARAKDGLDLYLPVELMHGQPVGASFIVAEGRFDSLGTIDPAMMVASLAAIDGSAAGDPVAVDDALAYRVEVTAGADAARDADLASRRVQYTIGVPDDPMRWLVVAFSTIGAGSPDDEVAFLLVELFDAIMTTFRWRRRATS